MPWLVILFLTLFGPYLLPNRAPHPGQMVARRTGSDLEEAYQLDERLWEVRVPAASPIVGRTITQTRIGDRLGLTIAAIWRGQQALFAPRADYVLQGGDILLTVGREERITQLVQEGLKVGRNGNDGSISARGVRFIELLLAPHSDAEGHTIRQLEFRKKYGFTVVALLREGRSYRTDVANLKLKMGDSILMVGGQDRLKALQNEPNYVVLEPDLSDQPVNKQQALKAVAIIGAAIAASIAGVPVFLAMLTAAVVVFLTGLLTTEEAYRAVEWPAIFLIAGMYAVSKAMVETGLADWIGQQVVAVVLPYGPLGLAAGSYLLTAGLTQLMGGQVSALVTGPVAISAAINLHTSAQAMAVAAAIGCSASFLTPIAHPVNILMIAPGNYRFGDFFRVGWVLTLVSFVMLLVGMALFWRL